MTFARQLRALLKKPLAALTSTKFLRQTICHELKQRHYDELDLSVPLGFDYFCPVLKEDYWYSFSEIFVNQDYRPAFDYMPLPDRWIDIGCHAGFFSLFVAWLRARSRMTPDFKALLIDADSRTKAAVDRLVALNKMENSFSFVEGAISLKAGANEFVEGDIMSSSLSSANMTSGSVRLVQSLPAERLLQIMPPPYDLLKVDLEGAEYDLLSGYQPLLSHATYLLLEWHSWHSGGGGRKQIENLAGSAGFELICEVAPAREVDIAGRLEQSGLSLYRRAGPLPNGQ